MSMQMSVWDNGFAVIGPIFLNNIDPFIDILKKLLETNYPILELDLARSEAIDTAGLQVLISAKKSAEEKNKRLVIKACSATIINMMQTAGLDAVFALRVEDEVF